MKPILDSASSKICWQIVLCSVNMRDLDIPQDLQVNKMDALLTNIIKEQEGYLKRLVWQVKDLHPHEMIYNVANELFRDEDINWGCIIALCICTRSHPNDS